MAIIDCYTLLGSWPQAEVELSIEALAAGMQSRGVTRSLVTHTTSIFYDEKLGNDQIIDLCSKDVPLTPVAVVNPLRYPTCLDEVKRSLGRGVRVFRLCPREHRYGLTPGLGPLQEVLAALRKASLLLVDVAGLPAPILETGLAEALPVPTAFTVDGEGLGTLIQAARASKNVWGETSSLLSGGAIEAAVEHMGADRLVFGSQAPFRTLGSAVVAVQYAELAEEQRAAIFEGNLKKALDEGGDDAGH